MPAVASVADIVGSLSHAMRLFQNRAMLALLRLESAGAATILLHSTLVLRYSRRGLATSRIAIVRGSVSWVPSTALPSQDLSRFQLTLVGTVDVDVDVSVTSRHWLTGVDFTPAALPIKRTQSVGSWQGGGVIL